MLLFFALWDIWGEGTFLLRFVKFVITLCVSLITLLIFLCKFHDECVEFRPFPVAFRLGFFDYENNHPKEQQMN